MSSKGVKQMKTKNSITVTFGIVWVNEATDGKSKSWFFWTCFKFQHWQASTWSTFVKILCKKIQQAFSQFFISLLLLEGQNVLIGMQNLDEGADSTFQGPCAKIFQSCKEKCKQPQLSVSHFPAPTSKGQTTHILFVFPLFPLFYFNFELSKFLQ